MKILVLHGPNLNLIGLTREKAIYGNVSLKELNRSLINLGKEYKAAVSCKQSNCEGTLIDILHKADGCYDYILFNPGAYTHYSYALRDAVSALATPVIEIHITNIYARENFRNNSVIAPVCMGQITGFGVLSYHIALRAVLEKGDF